MEKKTEAPKTENLKPEKAKAEKPKTEKPKAAKPKADKPKTEKPRAEAAKKDAAKTEAAKKEAPKTEAPKADAPKYFVYDGKPMVRRGDVIYYGDPKEKYIIIFTINSKKTVGDLEVADSVTIELSTNNGHGKEKIIRKAKREGLYSAFDIGEFWLRDTLENAQA